MKHTPGSWEVVRPPHRKGLTSALMEDNPNAILIISRSTAWPLGTSIAALSESEEGKANARLIAAAPAMLEALEDAEFSLVCLTRRLNAKEENNENLQNVRAAIAKAKGERK